MAEVPRYFDRIGPPGLPEPAREDVVPWEVGILLFSITLEAGSRSPLFMFRFSKDEKQHKEQDQDEYEKPNAAARPRVSKTNS